MVGGERMPTSRHIKTVAWVGDFATAWGTILEQ